MATVSPTETLVSVHSPVAAQPVQNPERNGGAAQPKSLRWKVCLDHGVALVLLLPCLVLIALLALLVRLTSRGPAIYRQKRVGKDGRGFTLFKLRTMRTDAEEATGAVWSKSNDSRVTAVGGMLRRLHLDELPQVFNVLKGEMSFVGPRPERPEIVPGLEEKIPGYCDRLAVLPGITGLAQLNLPPDRDLDDVRRKLVLDLEYIRTAGLFLDLRLILGTAARVLKLPVLGMLGLERHVRTFGAPPPFVWRHSATSAEAVSASTAHRIPLPR